MPVVELWRYPVKSMGGERLDAAEVGPAGFVGDRRWSLFDRDTGKTLTARRVPELLLARSRVTDDGDGTGAGVEIELPDGSVTADDDALSRWLGRDVELRDVRTVGGGATYEIARDDDGEPVEHHDWISWEGPAWSFHDSTRTQVSIVSTATLGVWDRRRFRANVVVGSDVAMVEDGWVGREVGAGTARLEVTKRIDRCVMVTRPQQGGIDRDLDVLRTINRERSGHLAIGALVAGTGTIAVGDLVGPDRPV
ncbi:MAG: MOSC N-terminal beta barrel domain-containing protein [Actinobacteria bacterium]|nr:MOSC N-terminal beta barrel domain-containing protein [Actinomycetota bacterium]